MYCTLIATVFPSKVIPLYLSNKINKQLAMQNKCLKQSYERIRLDLDIIKYN